MTTLTITNTTISKLGGPGSCADAIVENSNASYTTNVQSGDTLVVPDTVVRNSDTSYTANVPSTNTLVLPNNNINVNGTLSGQVTSVKTVDVQLTNGVTTVTPTSVSLVGNTVNIQVPAAVSRSTAKLMKTGQTTSYRTGDDGDLEAGRNTSFTVLAENNPFGNTNRFTDELGGQTYTNNIVIDWSTYDGSTVLGWRRTTNGVDISWNNAIDGALLVSIGTFTTGWRLPNYHELNSLLNLGSAIANSLNYSPFNLTDSTLFYWTSSTYVNIAWAYALRVSISAIAGNPKTNTTSFRYIPCRTFTVTGTTLS